MIKHFGKIAIFEGVLALLMFSIFFFGEPNMFTLPIALVFSMATAYCAFQWHVSKLFAKIEAKNPKWK